MNEQAIPAHPFLEGTEVGVYRARDVDEWRRQGSAPAPLRTATVEDGRLAIDLSGVSEGRYAICGEELREAGGKATMRACYLTVGAS